MKNAKKQFFDSSKHQFNNLDTKGLNQLVTDIDVATEKYLVKELSTLLPGSSFIAEENSGKTTDAEFQWIIDPLDGTTNFIHQIPVYSISIALQQNGVTVAGFVYELNRDELFWADETGAFLNDNPIQVSSNVKMQDSLLATGFPYYTFEQVPQYLEVLEYGMKNTRGIRRLGSAAVDLAYVACGRFDAFFEVGLSPWDVAGGAFIVEKAGGVVYDFNKKDNYIFGQEILAGNHKIGSELLEVIQEKFGKV